MQLFQNTCLFIVFPWPMLVLNIVLLIHMLKLMFEKKSHTHTYYAYANNNLKRDLCACLKRFIFQILKQSLGLMGSTYAIFLLCQ